MNLSAFQANEAARAALLAAFSTQAASGCVIPRSLYWDGEKGSVVGCLMRSDDLAQWELQLGLPQWLAVTLDALCVQQPSVAAANQLAVQALNVINPGADLRPAGSLMILGVLEQLITESRQPPSAQLQESLHAVGALHRRAASRISVAGAEWRAVRKAATTVTDLSTDDWEKSCATCIETAAWDPEKSSAVVFDTLRMWRNALTARAASEYGWDAASDASMQDLLNSIHLRYVRDAPAPQPNVFEMLAKYYPEEDARLRGKYLAEKDAAELSNKQINKLFLEVLASG